MSAATQSYQYQTVPLRPATVRCVLCAWQAPSRLARCPCCGRLGTLAKIPGAPAVYVPPIDPVIELAGDDDDAEVRDTNPDTEELTELVAEIDDTEPERSTTGNPTFDRCLGTPDRLGLAHESVVMVAGGPGVGKSTLFTEISAYLAQEGDVVLYVGAEEAKRQLAIRTKRVGLWKRYPRARKRFRTVETTHLEDALDAIGQANPSVVIWDSLAKFKWEGRLAGEVRASEIIANRTHGLEDFEEFEPLKASFIVAHGTKDGDVRGPLTAEHNVDFVGILEHYNPMTGEALPAKRRMGFVRLLVPKNRYGDGLETGQFRMTDHGLVPYDTPIEEDERPKRASSGRK